MLPVGWLVLAVAVAVVLTAWITFTLTRMDRLHARVDAAQAALDAELVRRAAALAHVADAGGGRLTESDRVRIEGTARLALDRTVGDQGGEHGPGGDREAAENAVAREVAALVLPAGPPVLTSPLEAELREAAARVLIARRFYNDAVRDTRHLRAQAMPRLLHLAGHREMPDFFDIDDSVPPPAVREPARGETARGQD